MAGTFHGEPMDMTTALGDQVQVIRLGRAIGLGAIHPRMTTRRWPR